MNIHGCFLIDMMYMYMHVCVPQKEEGGEDPCILACYRIYRFIQRLHSICTWMYVFPQKE